MRGAESSGISDGLSLGPLSPLLHLPGLTDIAVDPDGSVWADTGEGMHRRSLTIPLDDARAVRRLAVFLCAQLGVPLDDAHPVADASTPSGLRLNALLPPLVPAGAAISVRVPSAADFGLDDLERAGFFPDPCLPGLLRGLLRHRASLLLTGGTGTGKTTLLRALLRQTDPTDRLVLIEEVRELGGVDHPDVVSLAARPANAEGKGAVGLDALVEASLRMRPDRIVLGECRGPEAADVLRAFNTGHRGGMLTLHADGVARVPARLLALAAQGGMDGRQASALLSGAFDAVIHCERRGGRRFVSQVGVLEDSPAGPVGHVLARCSPTAGLRPMLGWQEFIRHWGIRCWGMAPEAGIDGIGIGGAGTDVEKEDGAGCPADEMQKLTGGTRQLMEGTGQSMDETGDFADETWQLIDKASDETRQFPVIAAESGRPQEPDRSQGKEIR
jgi:pilus assembly protein CpaF